MTDIGTAPARGALDSDALSELREGFRGDVIEPGDARYDETRQIFNGMFDRRPAAILRPTGTADVIRAIGLARLTGPPVRDPQRRPLGRGLLELRRRDRARPARAQGNPHRPRAPHRARPGGRRLGRARPRDAAVRPRRRPAAASRRPA